MTNVGGLDHAHACQLQRHRSPSQRHPAACPMLACLPRAAGLLLPIGVRCVALR